MIYRTTTSLIISKGWGGDAMLITIAYLFPGLSVAASTALRALLWSVVLLVALALAVAVCVAVAPMLPQLVAASAIIAGYAGWAYPRSKAVRNV